METKRFQAPFRVITLGSIQIENQIEKPSAKELTAWLLSKLYVIGQLEYRLKMIIQTERFQESSCKHCRKQPLLKRKIWPLFGLTLWKFKGKVLLFSLLEKN